MKSLSSILVLSTLIFGQSITAGTAYTVQPWVSASNCSRVDAMNADAALDHLNGWASIHRSFILYEKCDDGAIAEGYSDAVAKLLALHWSQLGQLSKLIKADPMFGRFVLAHIDETISIDQARSIAIHARDQCPAKLEVLCKKIQTAATS